MDDAPLEERVRNALDFLCDHRVLIPMTEEWKPGTPLRFRCRDCPRVFGPQES